MRVSAVAPRLVPRQVPGVPLFSFSYAAFATPWVIPVEAGVQGWVGGNVARSKTTRGEGLVPRLGGEQPAHTTIPRPSHPNILDTQHSYSGESKPRTTIRGRTLEGRMGGSCIDDR